ncbi:MAG: serine/threonine protein kinase [Symploca sp. SIO2E9]|nr:serine/threonine protein kinase [Symploca sp. SIO2E9]
MRRDLDNGRLLANRYQLLELIGKGAMGRVYQARDMLLGGVIVAVKFLSQTLLTKNMRQRFEREATICALLGEESIHIVRVRDYGVDENEVPFYVMEYIDGESLSQVIRKRPLNVPRFLKISRQICLGLQRAHQGIVFEGKVSPIIHRDIKPSNILIAQDSSVGELIKILDFGIAKLLESESDQTNSFMGTLAYCSPEQMEGKELDERSDLYSLGVMMFEMLTGEMPIVAETRSFGGWYKAHRHFSPRPFESVNPNLILPKPLRNLVMRCLAKEPSQRPQNAVEVLQVLESFERRYIHSQHVAKKIADILEKSPVVAQIPTKHKPSADEICRHSSWPKDKPHKSIVFPHIITSTSEALATLWVMLTKQDIQNRQTSTRYNQFLCVISPHPMVLWITALHNREFGVRWLPCYLDLKTNLGQRMVRLLGEGGCYRILFFALSEPAGCQKVMTSTIAPLQCQRLKEWANISQTTVSTDQPHRSKRILKQEYEKLKSKILIKLEALHSDYPTDISD